jgi:adenylate cyclase, class 2
VPVEIEAKFLNIDVAAIRQKLLRLGAVCVQPECLMRRYTFDPPLGIPDQEGAWLRVRDEGDKITLSYKRLRDRSVTGTSEISLVVDDFEQARQLLHLLKAREKSYQETRRETWTIGSSEVTIDTWPWIPSFVEIESPSVEELQRVAESLQLDLDHALHGSVETAYMEYYNVTEEEVCSWPTITFGPVPGWLAAKRRALSCT